MKPTGQLRTGEYLEIKYILEQSYILCLLFFFTFILIL